jgi:hypothetical protein
MRDLVWTLILIWFAWQVVNIFRSAGTRKQASATREGSPQPEPERVSERQRKLDTEGEYVDFEEVK